MNRKISRIWKVQDINNDGYFNDYLDRGLMTPDEYAEYICRSDEIFHKGGTVRIYSQDGTIKEEVVEKISVSWKSYLGYLGISNEQLEKDRLAPDYDFNKAEWKYYQETLDRIKQWEREEAKEKSLD